MFKLRDLPYEKSSFCGLISQEAFDFHYGKHHQTYVNNLNNMVSEGEFKEASLYDIITKSSGGIFNNSAQIYNHDFYWDSITDNDDNKKAIDEGLLSAIGKKFGCMDKFKEEFIKLSTTLFGSGWCWLVYDMTDAEVKIVQTSNAATPVTSNQVPLMVVDVWEHAYYIDHRNARPSYLEKFYSSINWAFASECYRGALQDGMESVKSYISRLHG